MKLNRTNALRLWESSFGSALFAADFHGNLMYRDAYGSESFFIIRQNRKIFCGWNIHHILPVAQGGTDTKENLICTNIITNNGAEDKITFWIDDCLYQVRYDSNNNRYGIFRINGRKQK